MNTQPDWTFTGTITHREDRQTAKGKAMQNLVIMQTGSYGPVLCVCVHFGDLPETTGVGKTVTADGWMNGREYNGKHYAGLRASRLYVQGHESPADKPAAPASEQPSGGDDSLPF